VIHVGIAELCSAFVLLCYARVHKKWVARVRACNSNRNPKSGQNYRTILKIEHRSRAATSTKLLFLYYTQHV